MKPSEIATYRTDLLEYNKLVFRERKGFDMLLNQHQNAVCEALEKVVIGKIKRLIINIPPRSGKTEMAVVNFISWCMGNFPHSHFIHASYSKRLAAKNTYEARAAMQTEVFREVFLDVSLSSDATAKDEFRTTDGGIVYATGCEGTITGYGAGSMGKLFGGAIIIDDPHKASEVDKESGISRQNVIDWFQTTMESRKNSPDTPIVVIMQRLHESDLAGWLLSGGNGEHWDLLKIPAIDEDGKSFWERQFPLEMLERLEKSNPYVFAGQYMQEPSPKTGGHFEPSKIEIVDALPRNLKFIRGWDLASTIKKTSDYTSSTKLAIDKDGVTWISEVDRFKGTPDIVENTILMKAKLDKKETFISIPQDPGQAGVAQKANMSKKLNGYSFEFTPESGDKVSRSSPFAAQVNAGNVRMLKGDWNEEFLSELKMFPRGSHDDQVDSTSRAYNKALEKPVSVFDVLF